VSGPDTTPATTSRRRRAGGAFFDIDRSVPALMFKIGSYPAHHGGVGLVRTLGRLGIDVFAVTEDAFTPAARSRYLREALVWPTTAAEPPDELVDGLLDIGRRIGRRAVIYVTDEEAAILIAEHADRLRDRFYLPEVPPGLPRQLASKWGLAELCREHGVGTPPSASPRSHAELVDAARSIGFPVALKNDEAWDRVINPAVYSTTVVYNIAELERVASRWTSMPSVIVQKYVPYENSEDWVTQIYAGSDMERWLTFTGVKVRSWPAFTGATAIAYSAANATLADLTASLCRSTGFRGIAALDWRMDLRDGTYYLLDFNPRVGMNFRLFETSDGVDVVRAMHLDLTGRALPPGTQIDGRRFIAEQFAAAAAIAYRSTPKTRPERCPPAPTEVERAWAVPGDPLPGLLAAGRLANPAVHTMARQVVQLGRRSAEAIRIRAAASSSRR
jgi:predicted ATP-grasp superfamily ATP-dependent carboligase